MSKKEVIYQFKMYPCGMSRRISKGNQEGPLGTDLGTSQSPIPYWSAEPDHRTSSRFGVFYYSGQRDTGCHQDHKGSHVHQSKWPIPQQELGEIQGTPHMGRSTTGHSFTSAQVTQQHHPSFLNRPSPYQTPYMGAQKFVPFGKYGPFPSLQHHIWVVQSLVSRHFIFMWFNIFP